MIRVLLAEDQGMVRGALAALLGMEPDIEVVGVAADGEGAWRELQRLRPDVLVTDIEMPGLTGLELAQRVQRHELPTRVLIVTTFGRAGFLRRALEAGVRGYLLKDAPAERLAGEGLSSAEIATRMGLSQGTVRNYLSEAIGKLGVGNRIEAYRLARQKGWL